MAQVPAATLSGPPIAQSMLQAARSETIDKSGWARCKHSRGSNAPAEPQTRSPGVTGGRPAVLQVHAPLTVQLQRPPGLHLAPRPLLLQLQMPPPAPAPAAHTASPRVSTQLMCIVQMSARCAVLSVLQILVCFAAAPATWQRNTTVPVSDDAYLSLQGSVLCCEGIMLCLQLLCCSLRVALGCRCLCQLLGLGLQL